MTFSYLFPLLSICLVILQTTLGSELISNNCLYTSANFTSPAEYNTNVKSLLKFLTSRSTLASTSFSMGSMGQPNTQRAYGFINCRPDVSRQECKGCGQESTKAARMLCPGSQGAVLWYDSCTLKYSDSDFLGSVDTLNQFMMWSFVMVKGEPYEFNVRVMGFLDKLSKKAANNPRLFAKAKTKADASTTVYGVVSCSRDLSSGACGSCLQQILGEFNTCCNGSKGGRVVAASCMFRYEMYPF